MGAIEWADIEVGILCDQGWLWSGRRVCGTVGWIGRVLNTNSQAEAVQVGCSSGCFYSNWGMMKHCSVAVIASGAPLPFSPNCDVGSLSYTITLQ